MEGSKRRQHFQYVILAVLVITSSLYLIYRNRKYLRRSSKSKITSPPSNIPAPVVNESFKVGTIEFAVVAMVVEMLQRGILTLIVKEKRFLIFKPKHEFILTKSAESNRQWENVLLRRIYQPTRLYDNLFKDLRDDIRSAIANYYDEKGLSGKEVNPQWLAFKYDYFMSSRGYAEVSDSDQFDSYLPYAIALGCSSIWIGKPRRNREIALPRWLAVPDIHDATKTSVLLLDVDTARVLTYLLESIEKAFGYFHEPVHYPAP